MKKFISVITASLLLAMPCIYELLSVSASAESGEFFLSYTFSGSGAEVTDISGSGTDLVIPDAIDDIPVISIAAGAFSECSDLESVTIPDSVASIGDKAFWNCSSLESVSIGSGTSKIGSYAFAACPSLAVFEVSSSNQTYTAVEGMLFTKDETTLVCYAGKADAVVPEGTVTVGKAAFFGNSGLESAKLPATLRSIGDYAFSGCFRLSQIMLPGSVTALGKGSFMNCTSLSQAVLGSGITEIPDECFSMCTSLAGVNISSSVTRIGSEAFFSCSKLSGIELPDSAAEIGTDAIGTHYNMLTKKNSPIKGFYICGKTGSEAEKYADSTGVDFIDFSAVPYGDVDGDGAVNASDASVVLKEYTNTSTGGLSSFTYYQNLTGDYNIDGFIDASDASLILKEYTENATGH